MEIGSIPGDTAELEDAYEPYFKYCAGGVSITSLCIGLLASWPGQKKKRTIDKGVPDDGPFITIELHFTEPPTSKRTSPLFPPLSLLPEVPAYSTLRCTQKDREQVTYVVNTLSQGLFRTTLSSLTLKSYDKELNSPEGQELHPYKFLSIIFTNSDAKKHIPEIFNALFLKNGFMEGVCRGMNREKARNNLLCYLEPFAQEVNVLADELRPLITGSNWEGVVKLLMQPSPQTTLA